MIVVSLETAHSVSRLRAALAVLLVPACASNESPRSGDGNDAGTPGSSGGAASGAGGAPVSGTGGGMVSGAGGSDGGGSGSAGVPGTSGTAGAAGSAASAGVAGTGIQTGGAAGAPSNGGASAAVAGASGTAGDPGGRAGDAGSGGRGRAGAPSGGASDGGASGAPAGCDWMSPEGRITLFDGSTLSGFRNSTTGGAAPWRLVGDGSMEVVPSNPSTNVETVMEFEDLCLHLEYQTPMYPANVTGQQRGNSGIYFKRSYEMQVLDTYGQPPAIDGCGAVYGISAPLEVACNMQLVWNTYEIEFKASRWDGSGAKTENAVFVSATLNGTVVQRSVELDVTSTTAGEPDASGPGALMLQDHGNPVRFRNIWAKVPRY